MPDDPKMTPTPNQDTSPADSPAESVNPVPDIEREPATQSSAAPTSIPVSNDAESFSQANDIKDDSAAAPVSNGSSFSDAQPLAPAPVSPAPTKSKKKWVIGGIVAGVLALLVGGGALAYTMYQSPDKVIMDGFANLLKTTGQDSTIAGNVTYKDKDMSVVLTLDAKGDKDIATGTLNVKYTSTADDLDVEGSADFAADKDSNGYVKLNDVDKLIDVAADAYIDSMAVQYEAFGQTMTEAQKAEIKSELLRSIDPVVEKINNRWIKFDASQDDEQTAQQKCYTDAFEKLQSDDAMRNELTKAYGDNKFIEVKEELGLKDGSYGYVLDIDQDKLKAFGQNTKESAFAKEITKCDATLDSVSEGTSEETDDLVKDGRFELWVSQWSHQITGVKFTGTNPDNEDASVVFDLKVDYAPVEDLELPKDAVDSKELQKEFESLMMDGDSTAAPVTTSTIQYSV